MRKVCSGKENLLLPLNGRVRGKSSHGFTYIPLEDYQLMYKNITYWASMQLCDSLVTIISPLLKLYDI